MKIVFLSNYFNHHQTELCNSFYVLTEGHFLFIETAEMSDYRKALGWNSNNKPKYVFFYNKVDVKKELSESDFIIWGDVPFKYVFSHLCRGKIVFRYSERLFKTGVNPINYFVQLMRALIRYLPFRNEYLLCASSYAYSDFLKVFSFKNHAYKWGYYPPFNKLDMRLRFFDGHLADRTRILWVGRLIDWKHPEVMLELAEKLQTNNYEFEMRIIGTGEMLDQLRSIKEKKHLDSVFLDGAQPSSTVREIMEKSDIFISTSDFNEGWGAVVNEAMNSGCAVIASAAIGSASYLIKENENGFIYQSGNTDELYSIVCRLLNKKSEIERVGRNAYKTIESIWNGHCAAERLVMLYQCLVCDKKTPFRDGPCSRA